MKFLQLSFLVWILFLSACYSKNNKAKIDISSSELYQNGLNALKRKKYNLAIQNFSNIFFQNPGDNLTPLAELMQAYTLYKKGDYDDSIDILNMFIKLYPAHQYISYAYYLKCLSYYMDISNSKLDQSRTMLAKIAFEELITLFPNTSYAIDAGLKLDLLNEYLAAKEIDLGIYYLKRKNLIAAINRFQNIVLKYSTTIYITEALYRLIESYNILGLDEESTKYHTILCNNYPKSIWCKYSLKILSS